MDIEAAEGEGEKLPYPRDLLRRIAGTSCSGNPSTSTTSPDSSSVSASASGEMDLCLGLSLGGCFAVEPRRNKLVRSSSIAALSIFPTEKDFPPAAVPLARTCSLPVEAGEENRKRKEMQSLKRLEAKRKREEKRNLYPPISGSGLRAVSPEKTAGLRRSSSNFDGGASGGMGYSESSIMEEMPCVSTKGDGPNGRRIEGFLYKYKKGEEVRIVCVCHGSFLTPAEFIKHAGGGNVEHPLRHIVVNRSTSSP